MTSTSLPLQGIRVIELAGLAPAPFCGMILSDFGADVVRVDPHGTQLSVPVTDLLCRGKKSLALNLRSDEGKRVFFKLVQSSDVLLDPYRPGTLEKLGLSPTKLLETNPRLIVARISGYGQKGPKALDAGHDINYIASSGILEKIRRKDGIPLPPLNLLADFAGGAVMGAFGILTAVIERGRSGSGQVIDVSMTDGARYLSSFIFLNEEHGMFFSAPPGEDLLDSGAPFYGVYETSDKKFMAVGCIEPKFYKIFLEKLNLNNETDLSEQMDSENWTQMKNRFEQIFKTKTQEEWTKIFENTDACVTPVLTSGQVRKLTNSVTLSQPAPVLSRTPPKSVKELHEPIAPGTNTVEILIGLGYSAEEISKLSDSNIVGIEEAELKSKL